MPLAPPAKHLGFELLAFRAETATSKLCSSTQVASLKERQRDHQCGEVEGGACTGKFETSEAPALKQDLSRKLRGIASSVNGALVSLESQAETRGKLESTCERAARRCKPQARSVPAASTQPGGSSIEPCWHDGETDEAEVEISHSAVRKACSPSPQHWQAEDRERPGPFVKLPNGSNVA